MKTYFSTQPLFGEKATKEIIDKEVKAQRQDEETKNSYALKEEELRAIVWNTKINNINELFSLLSFQTFNSSAPISWTDPKTNITVKLTPE